MRKRSTGLCTSAFQPTRRQFGALVGGGAFALASAGPAHAAFPEKSFRFVVPFAPGGSTNIIARLMEKKCEEIWSKTAVVENRGGGATIPGSHVVATSPPDGHTLLVTTTTLATNASRTDLPYNTANDLLPIGIVARAPFALAISNEIKADTLADFIKWVKDNPGKVKYASSGIGSSSHLAVELLQQKGGMQMGHVPYTATGTLIPDLISNRIQMTMANLGGLSGYAENKQIRILALGDSERSQSFPNIPTVSEAGVPGYEASAWTGVFAQGKTPANIAGELNGFLKKCYDDPAFRSEIARGGGIPTYMDLKASSDYFNAEIRKWREVIVAGNVQVQQ